MYNLIIHFLLCLLLITFPAIVWADSCQFEANQIEAKKLTQLSLVELMQIKVVTVSKTTEDIDTAPGVVTLISREEIKQFGGNSLFEILDRVAGVYMTGSVLYPQNNASIRGDMFNGLDRHVLTLLNGRPFRDALNGGINPIYQAFPLAAIERIEIVRGPGSILYGTNAYSGVINIITSKQAQFDCLTGTVSVGQGAFSADTVDAYASLTQGDLHLAGGIKYFDEKGWTFQAQDTGGPLPPTDMSQNTLGLTLNGSYQAFDFNVAWLETTNTFFQSNPQLQLTPNSTTYARLLADIGHYWNIDNQQRLETHLTYNRNFFNDSMDNSHFDNFLLETTYSFTDKKMAWLLGGSVEYMRDYRIKTSRPISAIPNYDEYNYTAYGQLKYNLMPQTSLILGGQGVKSPTQSWKFIPRLGIIHHFNDAFGTKLLYSEAYRSATVVERSINTPRVIGNPNLLPETINTVDFQLFYHQPNQRLSLTFFHSEQNDLIVRRPVEGQRWQEHFNEGTLKLRGAELEGKLTTDSGWFLKGALTYQENEHDSYGEDYTLASNWLLKLGVSYEFPYGLTMGVFNTYVSKAPDVSIRNPDRLLVNPIAEAYNLMTLNVDWSLSRFFHLPPQHDLVINGYLYNVLDESIYVPEINLNQINTVPNTAGRSGYIRLRYRF